MFVTAKLLKTLKACEDQRDRFAELFPQGVELARELIVQHAQEFDWWWCANNLASAAGRAAYRRAVMPAYAAYNQAVDQARTAYLQSEEQVEAVYLEANGPALAAYGRAYEQVEAVYNLACATAFADAMGI